MASVNASVRIVKTMPFKGGLRTWSNRYHFNGGTPADGSHWHTLFDNITAAEKLVLDDNKTIVEALGYAAGSEVPVATKTYSIAGTLAGTGTSNLTPGEVAALVRYSTAARSTKNHPIYCFNYYHAPFIEESNAWRDSLWANTKTALGTYAAAWISGFSDGTITAVRASPAGHVATGQIVEEYATHRDFPFTNSV